MKKILLISVPVLVIIALAGYFLIRSYNLKPDDKVILLGRLVCLKIEGEPPGECTFGIKTITGAQYAVIGFNQQDSGKLKSGALLLMTGTVYGNSQSYKLIKVKSYRYQ